MKVLSRQILRSDPTGDGSFGARRSGGTRKHKGVDLVSIEKEDVFSPIDGITRNSVTSSLHSDRKLVEISNANEKVKLMYVAPRYPNGTKVKKGDVIGYALDTGKLYNSPKMLAHVHVEVYKKGNLYDPTSDLFNEKKKED